MVRKPSHCLARDHRGLRGNRVTGKLKKRGRGNLAATRLVTVFRSEGEGEGTSRRRADEDHAFGSRGERV